MVAERYPSGRRIVNREPLNENGHAVLREEIGRFGDQLHRGTPFEVIEDTIINPKRGLKVRFRLSPDNFPYPPGVSLATKKMLTRAHVRSRMAHIKLNVGKELVDEALEASEALDDTRSSVDVELPIVNHGSRPVRLRAGVKPVHLFAVPPASFIVGEELEAMLGPERPINMPGEEGENWFRYYETTTEGDEVQGAYLRINKATKMWIPTSSEVIDLPDFPTFIEARAWMEKNLFKRADDPDYPMPADHIWVADTMPMKLPSGVYGILDNDVFVDVGLPTFMRKGMHVESPFLEERSDTERVEVQGPADWARLKFARGQVVVG